MTLLREWVAEDLRIRNYSPRTVERDVSFERFLREFGKPLGRPIRAGSSPGQTGPWRKKVVRCGTAPVISK